MTELRSVEESICSVEEEISGAVPDLSVHESRKEASRVKSKKEWRKRDGIVEFSSYPL